VLGRCVMGHFVMGRFVMGRFVCESLRIEAARKGFVVFEQRKISKLEAERGGMVGLAMASDGKLRGRCCTTPSRLPHYKSTGVMMSGNSIDITYNIPRFRASHCCILWTVLPPWETVVTPFY
jgi:hypothetical protein